MPYLVDSNVFIQAKNVHYGFDFCPGFWDWIDVANKTGQVFSIEKVADEIKDGNDELAEWVGERDDILFTKPDDATVRSLKTISQWVSSQNYNQSAVNEFLQVADYYLVAHAHAHGDVVITHERFDPKCKKIKIPNVCAAVNVECMTIFDLLRHERPRFVLGSPN